MTFHLTAVQLLAGIGVLLALLMVWRAGARRARAAAGAARAGARLLSLFGRVLFTAGPRSSTACLVNSRCNPLPPAVQARNGVLDQKEPAKDVSRNGHGDAHPSGNRKGHVTLVGVRDV